MPAGTVLSSSTFGLNKKNQKKSRHFNTSDLPRPKPPVVVALPVSISARSGLSPFQVEGNYPVQAAFCLAGLSFPLCECIDLPPLSQHCVAAD